MHIKIVKRFFAAMMAAALVVSVCPSTVQAAVKPKKMSVKVKSSLLGASKILYVGGPAKYKKTTIKVTVKPAKAGKKVTYKISNKKVLKVSKKGVITAKKVGTAKVTVQSKVNKKLKKTIKIRVKKYTAAVKAKYEGTGTTTTTTTSVDTTDRSGLYLSASKATLVINGEGYKTTNLKAYDTASASTRQEIGVTWTSSDSSVVSVDASGKVTGLKAGSAVITATRDNGKTASCTYTVKYNQVSVHDPSIVKGDDGYYYIFGSHMAWAKSKDLKGWTTFTNNINSENASYTTYSSSVDAKHTSISNKAFKWASVNGGDTAYAPNGNLWAPDVIYNKELKKWCMYMSVNGDNYHSVIVMMTADSLSGNWTYAGEVVYSGFRNDSSSYDYYTNTDYVKATEDSTFSGASRYLSGGSWNKYYGNNAIDPVVKYDKEGNLWMIYGSWFGGIYSLKLDEKTGLRDYTYTYDYDTDDSDGATSDPYMGRRIAGGGAHSGEGAYIIQSGDYYYLFVSYGGLVADGGYNMRLFRSESINGPYKDKAGNLAINTASNTTGVVTGNVGIRLMSGYTLNCLDKGYLAQGHNSALVDSDGSIYLVYHTRFENSGEGHQVRVHKMYTSKDGWLCVAPYEYNEDSISTGAYSSEEIAGTYEYLYMNPAQKNGTVASSTTLTLGADGSIGGGGASGSWSLEGDSPMASFVINGITYEGVFAYGNVEDATKTKTMTFSAVGSNNVVIWGSKGTATAKSGKEAVTEDAGDLSLPSTVTEDFTLTTIGKNASSITWTSSDSSSIEIKDNHAKVTRRLEDSETITLTASITKDGASTSKTFTVVVSGYIREISLPETISKGTIELPSKAGLADVEWSSSNKKVISSAGQVNEVINDTSVTLTATLSLGDEILTKEYEVTVLGLEIPLSTAVKSDSITLPTSVDTYTISWSSSDSDIINVETGAVTRAETETQFVTLTATITKGTESDTRTYKITVFPIQVVCAYKEDYESVSDVSSLFASSNLGGGISIGSEGENHFLQFKQDGSSGNRGGAGSFDTSSLSGESYVIEADLAITSGNVVNRSASQFALVTSSVSDLVGNNNGITDNYLLKLSTKTNANGSCTTYLINDSSEEVEIPANTWVHITLVVNSNSNTVSLTISNGDTNLYSGNVAISGSQTRVTGMYILSGRGNGLTKVDNIKIY